jgi:hypothetical protein
MLGNRDLDRRDQVAVAGNICACRALRHAAIWPIEVAGSRELPLPKASDLRIDTVAYPCRPRDPLTSRCRLPPMSMAIIAAMLGSRDTGRRYLPELHRGCRQPPCVDGAMLGNPR